MHNDDYIDPRDRLLSIDLDDDDPPAEEADGGPQLKIGMEAVVENGQNVWVEHTIDEDDLQSYFLSTPEGDEEFQAIVKWLFIFSLAGARTFSDPIDATSSCNLILIG
jgi:hypothetical protein